MAHAVVSNNSRDLWPEVRKVQGRNSKISFNKFLEKFYYFYV